MHVSAFGGGIYPSWNFPGCANAEAYLRHGSARDPRANFVFVDGHVESADLQQCFAWWYTNAANSYSYIFGNTNHWIGSN